MTFLVQFADGWQVEVKATCRGEARALAGDLAQERRPMANHSENANRKYGDRHPLRIKAVVEIKSERELKFVKAALKRKLAVA